MRTTLRRMLLLLLALSFALPAGCRQQAVEPERANEPPVSPASSTKRVSIPSLGLYAADDLPNGQALEPGDALPAEAGPFLTGASIVAFEWLSDTQGLVFGFHATLDTTGTAQLAGWSTQNEGRNVVIALGSSVITRGPFARKVTDGQLYISGAEVVNRRQMFESAMVPFQ